MGNGKMFEKRLFWRAPVESETALMRNQQAFPDILLKESTQHTGLLKQKKGFDCFQEGGLQRKTNKRSDRSEDKTTYVYLPKQVGWKIGDEKAILSITEIHLEQ